MSLYFMYCSKTQLIKTCSGSNGPEISENSLHKQIVSSKNSNFTDKHNVM